MAYLDYQAHGQCDSFLACEFQQYVGTLDKRVTLRSASEAGAVAPADPEACGCGAATTRSCWSYHLVWPDKSIQTLLSTNPQLTLPSEYPVNHAERQQARGRVN
jgi:hypothetical protein